MKFSRTVPLVCFEDENGSFGLKHVALINTDNINAASGQTLAHDIIEHVTGMHNVGSVSHELQALGAFWYTRAECDRQEAKYQSTAQILGGDICSVFRDWNYSRETLIKGNPQETNQDYDYNQALEYAGELIEKEYPEEYTDAELQHFLAHALQLLRVGYSRAENLYKCQWFAWELFLAVEKAGKINFDGMQGMRYNLSYGAKPNGDAFAYLQEIYA